LNYKTINNQRLRELCQFKFKLNVSVLSLINNKISDLSSLNNDAFKKLIKLNLQQNNINIFIAF
jgi:Leucine-rich repeat (LRR) protein